MTRNGSVKPRRSPPSPAEGDRETPSSAKRGSEQDVGEDSLKLLESALSPSGEPVLGLYIHTAEQILLQSLRSKRAYLAIVPHLIGTPAILSVRPGISQTELGEYLGCGRAAAGKQVAACLKQGWIRREDSPHDKRRFRLYITPSGTKMLREAAHISPAHEREFTAPLTNEERLTLRRLLHKLIMGSPHRVGHSGR